MPDPNPARHDCLIVGGGPAGLTAAIYLARFHLSVVLVDRGDGRCVTIPRTRNHAGYPDGIPGADLVARMREQAEAHGTRLIDGDVTALERLDDGFRATLAGRTVDARAVLIATGVVNHRPDMDDAAHDDALARGLIRYCPICDGYEATDMRIAVLGTGDHGEKEAVFLRGYSRDVTLIAADGAHALSADAARALDDGGIARVDGPCGPLRVRGDRIVVPTADGDMAFDTLYPALGSAVRAELAASLGAETTDAGCLVVCDHGRTSIAGMYAAGDVVVGLDQISAAMGQAGIAATAIRNDLAEVRPLRR